MARQQIRLVDYCELSPEQHSAVLAFRNSARVRDISFDTEPISRSHHDTWVATLPHRSDAVHFAGFVDDQLAVTCSLKGIDREWKEVEWSISSTPEASSRIAVMTAFHLIDYVFEKLDCSRLYSHLLCSNQKALRFNESLGLSIAKTIVVSAREFYQLEMLAPEWQRQREKLAKIMDRLRLKYIVIWNKPERLTPFT